jgi:hypothetical protein
MCDLSRIGLQCCINGNFVVINTSKLHLYVLQLRFVPFMSCLKAKLDPLCSSVPQVSFTSMHNFCLSVLTSVKATVIIYRVWNITILASVCNWRGGFPLHHVTTPFSRYVSDIYRNSFCVGCSKCFIGSVIWLVKTCREDEFLVEFQENCWKNLTFWQKTSDCWCDWLLFCDPETNYRVSNSLNIKSILISFLRIKDTIHWGFVSLNQEVHPVSFFSNWEHILQHMCWKRPSLWSDIALFWIMMLDVSTQHF